MRKKRISVSLPPDMLAHYKVLAEECGVSVSRLIYLRLKSRKKSILVVGQDVLKAVKEIRNIVEELTQGQPPSEEVVQSLERYTRFLEKFVELDKANDEIVIGGGRHGD